MPTYNPWTGGFDDDPNQQTNYNAAAKANAAPPTPAANPFPQMPAYQTQNAVPINVPNVNMDPLHKLENFSQSGGNNLWVQAQMDALKQSQGQAMGAAKANAMSAGTAAADAAAARGGLTTGGQSNLARNTANNATVAGQDVIGKGLAQAGQIQSQNAQNELGVLSNLPGQEVQAVQPALQTASLNQAGLNAQNEFNLKKYATDVAQQAGLEQSYAQAHAGKK